MAVEIFERFLSPADRVHAVAEFADMGDRGVQVLEALFSRQATNDFGSPYRDIGAYACGLEAAARLGAHAKPLERHLREGVEAGYSVAAAALRKLDVLDPASVDALINAVESENSTLGLEAVDALLKHGLDGHPAIHSFERRSEVSGRFVRQLRSRSHP
jgi:hypothetical protein